MIISMIVAYDKNKYVTIEFITLMRPKIGKIIEVKNSQLTTIEVNKRLKKIFP